MRKLKFDIPELAEKAGPSSSGFAEPDANRVSIMDRMKRIVTIAEEPKGEEPNPNNEEAAQAQTEASTKNTSSAAEETSATFEDGFDEFKEGAEKKLHEFVENPEEFAIMFIRMGNLGRVVFLPGLYEKLMFPGSEAQDVRDVVRKVVENEKSKDKEVTDGLNRYELRLYDKWKRMEEIRPTIGYTEDEIKWLAKIVAKRIRDVSVAVWLEKYDWAIALLYLEFKHSQMIWATKAEDFVAKKFGL